MLLCVITARPPPILDMSYFFFFAPFPFCSPQAMKRSSKNKARHTVASLCAFSKFWIPASAHNAVYKLKKVVLKDAQTPLIIWWLNIRIREKWTWENSGKLMPLPNSFHYPTRTKLSKSLYVKRGIYVLNGRVEIAGGEKRQNNVTIIMIKDLVKISIIKKEEQLEKKFYKNVNLPFIYKKNDIQSLIIIQWNISKSKINFLFVIFSTAENLPTWHS